MKLRIKNLGPIKSGEIDLSKKIYVFTGYNNTGKTYLSQIMYALTNQRFFNYLTENLTLEQLGIDLEKESFTITKSLLGNLTTHINKIIETEIIPDTFNISKKHYLLKGAIVEIVAPDLEEIEKQGLKISSLVSLKDKDDEILYTISKEQDSLEVVFNVQELSEEAKKSIPSDILNSLNKDEIKNKNVIRILSIMLLKGTINSFYLPASRMFYPTFYQYIFGVEKEKREILTKDVLKFIEQSKEMKGNPNGLLKLLEKKQDALKGSYTQPTNNLINKIYNLNLEKKPNSKYSEYVRYLEQLIGGELEIRNSKGIGNIEFSVKLNNTNDNLDMYLASSSTNQLTALHLYFKYWVKDEDNFLIIDEPEENLHPAHQLALLKILLQFSSINNNRILMVNHTPLFTESLNNYLMLGLLKERYSEEEYNNFIIENEIENLPIKKDEVGFYFFNGQEVREYDVGEYGTVFKDFEKEIYKVKNISSKLSNAIFEAKEKSNATV